MQSIPPHLHGRFESRLVKGELSSPNGYAFAGEVLRSELRLYTNTGVDVHASSTIRAMLRNSVMSQRT
jgi:hypothetical protein